MADFNQNGDCSESTPQHNSNPGEQPVPARKKQPDAAAAPPASGRKKPAATKRAVARGKGEAARGGRKPANGSKKQALVVVESPTKARTITKYLGPGFKVLASMGHVRDLPKRRRKGEAVAGVDIEKGWVPSYVVVDDRHQKLLGEIKREAARSDRVFL